MSKNLHIIIVRVNVIRPVCRLVFGHNHSVAHRMVAGIAVAAFGVFIVKHFGHVENEFIAATVDGVGYGLHGLGLTPFAEYLSGMFAEA